MRSSISVIFFFNFKACEFLISKRDFIFKAFSPLVFLS
jgi:hypothetical protein